MAKSSRSEEHTSELQSHSDLVCRLLLETKKIMECGREAGIRTSRTAMRACRNSLFPSTMARVPTSTASTARLLSSASFFFFNDTATTEIYTLSLHDALPI